MSFMDWVSAIVGEGEGPSREEQEEARKEKDQKIFNPQCVAGDDEDDRPIRGMF